MIQFFKFILILFLLTTTIQANDQIPKTIVFSNGVFDISAEDLSREKIWKLEGEWLFTWKQFIEPTQDHEKQMDRFYKIPVPGNWEGQKFGSETGQGMGYGSYLMILKTGSQNIGKKISLRIPYMATASRIFFNGVLIAETGKIGDSRDTMTPQYYNNTRTLLLDRDVNFLIIHVSNFYHRYGGIWEPIELGPPEILKYNRDMDLALQLILFGSLLVTGIYHIGLFLLRRNDRSTIYFACVCIFISIRTLTTGEVFLTTIAPDFPWQLEVSLEYVTFYLSVPSFIYFFNTLYPLEGKKIAEKIFLTFGVLFTLSVLITDSTIFTKFMSYWYIVTVLSCLYCYQVIIRAVIKKREGAVVAFLGSTVLFVTTVMTILHQSQILISADVAALGLFIFIFSQSFILSLKFSRAFSENEKFSRKLLSLDKLKDEFLANTSHELRTPLNGIIGITESLLDGVAGQMSQPQRENLGIIASSSRRLANLVNDILDFSKMKNKEIDLQWGPVDLFQVTDMVLKVSKQLAVGKPIEIVNEVPLDCGQILGDENRIQQILYNLVGNAVKFTENGYVKISAKKSGDTVEISVSDTGIGIPPDKHKDIFKSFEQVDASTERNYGGTGLGLAITKQLVELHQSSIKLTSSLGQGSVFSFNLKKYDGEIPNSKSEDRNREILYRDLEEEKNEVPTITELPESESNGNIILVVDDESVNRKVLYNNLTLANYQIYEAINGQDALDFLNDAVPDLIILDVMMPGMSGFDVCKKIREKYSLYEIPILMLTAKTRISDIISGLESGANDYLPKPFDKRELMTRVRNLILLKSTVASHNKFILIQNELEVARKLQFSILPETPPDIQGLQISSRYIPMTSIGGDFFDFHKKSSAILGAVIADVSGHGIPAAIIAAMFKVSYSMQEEMVEDPEKILHNINQTLFGKVRHGFITASCICINSETGRLIFARAGHLPLIIINRISGQIKTYKPKGMAIGWKEKTNIEKVEIQLEIGDRILLYTDGITEAMDQSEEMLGDERLETLLVRNSSITSDLCIQEVINSVYKWTGRVEQDDDISVVVIDYR